MVPTATSFILRRVPALAETTRAIPAIAKRSSQDDSLIDVCVHSFDAGNYAGKQGRHCIGMPASDPSDETGIMEMAHNATAEKSGAAKYGHAQWHDAKVSPQLRLSRARRYPGRHRHRRDPPITHRERLGRRDQATAPFIEKGGHRRKPLSDGFDIDHHHNIWYGQTTVNPYLTLSKLDSIICGRALSVPARDELG